MVLEWKSGGTLLCFLNTLFTKERKSPMDDIIYLALQVLVLSLQLGAVIVGYLRDRQHFKDSPKGKERPPKP
jgi:hypothetical protein